MQSACAKFDWLPSGNDSVDDVRGEIAQASLASEGMLLLGREFVVAVGAKLLSRAEGALQQFDELRVAIGLMLLRRFEDHPGPGATTINLHTAQAASVLALPLERQLERTRDRSDQEGGFSTDQEVWRQVVSASGEIA